MCNGGSTLFAVVLLVSTKHVSCWNNPPEYWPEGTGYPYNFLNLFSYLLLLFLLSIPRLCQFNTLKLLPTSSSHDWRSHGWQLVFVCLLSNQANHESKPNTSRKCNEFEVKLSLLLFLLRLSPIWYLLYSHVYLYYQKVINVRNNWSGVILIHYIYGVNEEFHISFLCF